jgi:hypothetical protein
MYSLLHGLVRNPLSRHRDLHDFLFPNAKYEVLFSCSMLLFIVAITPKLRPAATSTGDSKESESACR